VSALSNLWVLREGAIIYEKDSAQENSAAVAVSMATVDRTLIEEEDYEYACRGAFCYDSMDGS